MFGGGRNEREISNVQIQIMNLSRIKDIAIFAVRRTR
jgi:hypothetical protein